MLKGMLVLCAGLMLLSQDVQACGRRHCRRCHRCWRSCTPARVATRSNGNSSPTVDELSQRYIDELMRGVKQDLKTVRAEFEIQSRRIPSIRPLLQEFVELESRYLKMAARLRQFFAQLQGLSEELHMVENFEREMQGTLSEIDEWEHAMEALSERADKIIEDYDNAHRPTRHRHSRLHALRASHMRR